MEPAPHARILERVVDRSAHAVSLCLLRPTLSKLGFRAKPIALGVTVVSLALLVKLIGAKPDLLFADGRPMPCVALCG